MKIQTTYKKVASYEAEIGKVKKILLLYSGGLDTSTMIKWLIDNYQAEVITITFDLGQQNDNLKAIKTKAIKIGAAEAHVYDLKQEFAELFIAQGIKANASYQGNYHLSTPMGRAVCAWKAVELAKKFGVDAIAHGCTGKGNDQVRFESYILAHDPDMKIVAPVREWNMSRNEQINYAKANNIPVPASHDFPYSVDDNMWGMTWEGGEIEDPKQINKIENFLTTYTLPENAPEQAEFVELYFEKGLPTKLNGNKLVLHELIMQLNKIAGAHGIGITQIVEDRLVGLKNGGVYEMPAAHTIISAHKALEKYVSTRVQNELKEMLDTKWAYLCYGSQWFDPVMKSLKAFNDEMNKKVNGNVTIKLFKGTGTIAAIDSEFGLMNASFNNNEGYDFNVNASPGFIEIYGLQMKLANQLENKFLDKSNEN